GHFSEGRANGRKVPAKFGGRSASVETHNGYVSGDVETSLGKLSCDAVGRSIVPAENRGHPFGTGQASEVGLRHNHRLVFHRCKLRMMAMDRAAGGHGHAEECGLLKEPVLSLDNGRKRKVAGEVQ